MGRVLTRDDVHAAALGGAVLGGGGGGWYPDGIRLGEMAVSMGRPELWSVNEVDPDSVVLTVSAVGAPAGKDRYLEPVDYLKAVELLVQATGKEPAAIITNENGGAATLNGWLQAACLGIPVLDAPCNGRAHPTGVMGSMGLHAKPDYTSIQAAVGGDRYAGRRVEMVARGSLLTAAALVRQAAVQAGGLVAVARNPVKASYVKQNAAVGAISQAVGLGKAMLDAAPEKRAQAAASYLGGAIACEGTLRAFELVTQGGFDVGRLRITSDDGVNYDLTFWNEYMTMDGPDGRIATFPDLMMTLDDNGKPLTTAELARGMHLAVLVVRSQRLILGAGMRDRALFEPVEAAIGLPVIPYVFDQ